MLNAVQLTSINSAENLLQDATVANEVVVQEEKLAEMEGEKGETPESQQGDTIKKVEKLGQGEQQVNGHVEVGESSLTPSCNDLY